MGLNLYKSLIELKIKNKFQKPRVCCREHYLVHAQRSFFFPFHDERTKLTCPILSRTVFSVVVRSLERLVGDGDPKAIRQLCSILQFVFNVLMRALCHKGCTKYTVKYTVPLSTVLQGHDMDVAQAAKESSSVISMLKQERNNENI